MVQKQSRLGKVIQYKLFVVPFQCFQGHICHCLLGHDDQLCHGLTIQSRERLKWIAKRVSGILETVTIMTESIHTANHPHWPKVYLNLANMILQLEVDNAIAIPPRFRTAIRLERRKLDTSNQRTERIACQFQQCQQCRKVLDDEQSATVIGNLQHVPLVLLFRLAQCRTGILHGTNAHLLHSQAASQRLANFHEAGERHFGTLDQIPCDCRAAHVVVLVACHLGQRFVGADIPPHGHVVAGIVQSRHAVEVRIDRVQLHPSEYLIVLPAIAQ
mmetsp:Transcript_18471/g.39950  ORF Transcript_18471/g.39950 Transcript_18471/m.39950 type:complete len:273 (-) Transcript_18471:1487-2305(-)